MTTLEKLRISAESIMDKIRRGEALTKDDKQVIRIFSSLYPTKAFNAGKRKGNKNVQKVTL